MGQVDHAAHWPRDPYTSNEVAFSRWSISRRRCALAAHLGRDRVAALASTQSKATSTVIRVTRASSAGA